MIQAYFKKKEKSQIKKNVALHLKGLEKEEQNKPRLSERKEIIKVRLEIMQLIARLLPLNRVFCRVKVLNFEEV